MASSPSDSFSLKKNTCPRLIIAQLVFSFLEKRKCNHKLTIFEQVWKHCTDVCVEVDLLAHQDEQKTACLSFFIVFVCEGEREAERTQ